MDERWPYAGVPCRRWPKNATPRRPNGSSSMADGSGTVEVAIPGPLQVPPVSTESCHRILSIFPDESTHSPAEKSSASLVKPITTSSIWPAEQAIEGKGSEVKLNENIPKFGVQEVSEDPISDEILMSNNMANPSVTTIELYSTVPCEARTGRFSVAAIPQCGGQVLPGENESKGSPV